ncbi:unnamed protein product [Psylliodes chrysocephalus]|uniref:C2H2-type domain-containing protein n=1 Tax=Psylliodes chrysocephalus TaxID=3402493 RepID=A0A9P0CI68_9CUCU|nr:unnamed protein product [Psylliodes chrysocephala]
MAEHSLDCSVEGNIEEDDEDFIRPEVIYEQDLNDQSESNHSNGLSQLGSLVEYVYDENQVQTNDDDDEDVYIKEEYLDVDIADTHFDIQYQHEDELTDGQDIIQPMMPFFLSSSPVFTIMNENDEVGETIILQIENETEEPVVSPKPIKPPSIPIPDEVRESTLQMVLCLSKTNSVVDTYTCEICNHCYGCLNCLKSHYETMHLGNTVISQYKCKFSTNVSKGLHCPVCKLIFDTRSNTMDHYITHAVACDICGSGFDRQKYLTEHLRTAHSKGSFDVWYDCELCKLTYQYGSSLSKHYQKFHKLILCVECNMKFENVTDLEEHEISHRQKAAVLPFACSKCDKAFAQISEIAVHIRQDHNHKRKMEEFETLYVISNKNRKPFKSVRKKLK